jgi:hypothetical protein
MAVSTLVLKRRSTTSATTGFPPVHAVARNGGTVIAEVPERASLVAVIVAEPAANAVTKPVLETVATAAALVVQVTVRVSAVPAASRGVAVSCSVCPGSIVPLVG